MLETDLFTDKSVLVTDIFCTCCFKSFICGIYAYDTCISNAHAPGIIRFKYQRFIIPGTYKIYAGCSVPALPVKDHACASAVAVPAIVNIAMAITCENCFFIF